MRSPRRSPSACACIRRGDAPRNLLAAAAHLDDVRPPGLLVSLGDSALVRRFLDGGEQAFRALCRRHTPRLRMIIARLLGPRRDDVDDVVQETWLAGCRGIHR